MSAASVGIILLSESHPFNTISCSRDCSIFCMYIKMARCSSFYNLKVQIKLIFLFFHATLNVKYLGISARKKKKKRKSSYFVCVTLMTHINLFCLQLFIATCSTSAIIAGVAGSSDCIFNPYIFGVLIIWKDFFMRKRIQHLTLITFCLAPK